MNSFVSKPLIGITKEDALLRQYASQKKRFILSWIHYKRVAKFLCFLNYQPRRCQLNVKLIQGQFRHYYKISFYSKIFIRFTIFVNIFTIRHEHDTFTLNRKQIHTHVHITLFHNYRRETTRKSSAGSYFQTR